MRNLHSFEIAESFSQLQKYKPDDGVELAGG